MLSAVAKKTEKHCADAATCQEESRTSEPSKQPRKKSSLICAAECFPSLHKFMGVESVWRIEMGLECCQRLPRKLINTVLMQHHVKRRAALEIIVADSRERKFSALA
jgi:hypothetical protein